MKGIGFSKIIVILIGQGTRPTDVPPPVDSTTAVSMGLFMALLIFFQVHKRSGLSHGRYKSVPTTERRHPHCLS